MNVAGATQPNRPRAARRLSYRRSAIARLRLEAHPLGFRRGKRWVTNLAPEGLGVAADRLIANLVGQPLLAEMLYRHDVALLSDVEVQFGQVLELRVR